ncbi:hypothetical protein Tco_0089551 [Tanacetum coccineum]
MAALVISISLDISIKSVGSSFLRVILIGSIFVEVPIAPEVGVAVASAAKVLKLDTHSLLKVNPSESSPPPVSVAPMVSLFLCSDDSESDTEILERHVSPTTSTLEIPTASILPAPSAIVAPSSEFPLASVDAPPGIRIRLDLYPVRPLPSHRLALRYTSHHLDHFTSISSSGHSSSDHSSSGHSILGHSLAGHSPPDTTVADSSTPQRFVHPPIARTPRCNEAYLRRKSAPLSTMYPLTTSESLAGDSSSESYAEPSRKRCRSSVAFVTSSTHGTRALVPSRADLLLPRKRFRDSISPEDSVKEDIDTDVLADIEADATTDEVAVYSDVEAKVDVGISMEVNVGVDVEDEVESSDRGTIEVGVDVVAGIDIPNGMLMPNAVERLEQVEEGFQDIYDHVIEIPLQRIEDIETEHRELEARSLIDSGERASLLEQVVSNMTITRSSMTPKAIKELVNRRVEEALAAYEATRAANALRGLKVSLRSLVTCLGLGFARSFTAPRPHGTYFPTTIILSSLAFYSSSLPLLLVTLFYLLSFSFLLLAYQFLLSYDCFLLATCNKHETYKTFYLLLAIEYATTFLLANLFHSLAILLHSFTLLLAIFLLSNIPCCCVLMLTRCDQKDLLHAFFFAA